jgi:hypothetical protein
MASGGKIRRMASCGSLSGCGAATRQWDHETTDNKTLFRFENMEIWQRAADISSPMFKLADKLDQRRTYRFAEQLRAAVLSRRARPSLAHRIGNDVSGKTRMAGVSRDPGVAASGKTGCAPGVATPGSERRADQKKKLKKWKRISVF